jgi:hypothetical protein
VSPVSLPDDGYVRLPRRISTAFLWGAVTYAVLGVASASAIYYRVAALEESDAKVGAWITQRVAYNEARWSEQQRQTERIVRLETQVIQQTEMLRRIEGKLDRR